MNRFVPDKNARIVMLGCGNSTLSRDMYDDGYRNIANIDYSAIVIEKMGRVNADRTGMTCQYGPALPCRLVLTLDTLAGTVGDVRNLPFEDQSIDVCLDKATLDAMLTSEKDPWVRRVHADLASNARARLTVTLRMQNPPPQAVADVKGEIDEVVRILKPTGLFLYL